MGITGFWSALIAVCLSIAFLTLAWLFFKLSNTAQELNNTLKTVKEQLIPITRELSGTIAELNHAAENVNLQLGKVDKLTSALDVFLSGGTSIAAKVALEGKNKLLCVLEGIKQGMKILRVKNTENEVS